MYFHFFADQLAVIYNTTLSQIICRNSDGIQQTRKYVMEHRKNQPNNIIECDVIRNFNFTPWNLKQQPAKLHTAHLSSASSKVRVLNNKQNSNVTVN